MSEHGIHKLDLRRCIVLRRQQLGWGRAVWVSYLEVSLNSRGEKLRVENTLPEPKYPKYTPWVRSETVPPQDRYKAYTEFKPNLALAVRQYTLNTDFLTVLFSIWFYTA
jgi:hypothetical protein